MILHIQPYIKPSIPRTTPDLGMERLRGGKTQGLKTKGDNLKREKPKVLKEEAQGAQKLSGKELRAKVSSAGPAIPDH